MELIDKQKQIPRTVSTVPTKGLKCGLCYEPVDEAYHTCKPTVINVYTEEQFNALQAEIAKLKEERDESISAHKVTSEFFDNLIIRSKEFADLLEARAIQAEQERDILRPEIRWFAEQMELALRENDHKTGWNDEHQSWLLGELYRNAGKIREDRGIVRAVNTANFAMMIADNARSKQSKISHITKAETDAP